MKKNYAIFFFSFLVLILNYQFVYSQGQANVWYFGKGNGLDFNFSPPAQLENGNTNLEYSATGEGVGSYSDANGNLLFYTNGNVIYDKTHTAMLNGQGLNGDDNTVQTGLIVPVQGSTTRYYAIQTGSGGGKPVKYVIVDMTLNGGLGDVDPASRSGVNAPNGATLIASAGEGSLSIPEYTAGNIPTGNYWIINHSSSNNDFYVSKATSSGISAPVTQTITGVPAEPTGQGVIMFKTNSCFDKIGAAFYNFGRVDILPFNNVTGVISPPTTILSGTGGAPFLNPEVYGIEFSPSGKFLYVTESGLNNRKTVYQFDISLGSGLNPAAVLASKSYFTGGAEVVRFGALQLAPDGGIYFPGWNTSGTPGYINVIPNPDVAWTKPNPTLGTDLQYQKYTYAVHQMGEGLPPFSKNLLTQVKIFYNNACEGSTTSFSYDFGGGVASQTWDFGDPGSGASNSSTAAAPSHTYSVAGTYVVTLTIIDNCGRTWIGTVNAIVKTGPTYSLPATLCPNTNITITGTGSNAANYTWSTSASGPFGSIGSSYVYNGALPATVYVQDPTPLATYTTGNTTATQDFASDVGDTRFELFTSVKLTSFQAIPKTASSATLTLYKWNGTAWVAATGTEAWSQAYTVTSANVTSGTPFIFSPNVTLSPGKYRLYASNDESFKKNNTSVDGGRDVSGVVNVYGDTDGSPKGGPYINIVFSLPDPCGIRAIPIANNCCVPPTITTQPASQSVCTNNPVTFTVATSAASPTYKWQLSTDNGSTWTDIAGQTSASYSIGSVTTSMNNYQYRAVINPSGCFSISNAATLTVNPLPAITSAASGSICSGIAENYSITSNVASSYSWSRATIANISPVGVAGQSSNPIAETLTNSTSSPINVTYVITPTSTTGSCVGTPFNYVVTVNPTPVLFAYTSTTCSGSTFTVTPVNGSPAATTIVPAGTTYSWGSPVVTGGITGGSAQSGQTSISQTLTNPTSTAQTATYTVTPTSGAGGSCVGATFTVTVTVNPTPVLFAYTSTICSGSTFTVTPVNGSPSATTVVPAGTTYSWGAPVVTGGITGGSAQAGQSSISQTLTNPTGVAQTATYTVTPTSGAAGSCAGGTFTVTVTVNPTPAVTSASSGSICSGTAQNYSITSNLASSYSWSRATVTNISPAGVIGQSSNPITETLTNSTSSPINVTYVITPTSTTGSCLGTPFNYVVAVNPATIITAQPTAPAPLCTGSALNLSVTATGTSLSYQWNLNAAAISGATNSSYSVGSVALTDAGSYTVTVTGSCGNVSSSAAVVNINGVVINTQPVNQGPCVGGSATFDVVASGPGLTYQWQQNTGSGFGNIPGATVDNYTIATTTAPMNGYTYRVNILSNGSCGVTSSIATLTINTSTTINSQPASAALCVGDPMILTVNGSGSGTITYQWKKGVTTIPGATLDTYSIASVVSTDAGSYSVDVNSSCGLTTSNPATITVNKATITANPTDQTICENGNHTFSVSATGLVGPLTYQWQTDNGTGSFTDMVGETSSTLVLSSVSLSSDGYKYRAIVKDNNLCPATSASATLTVNPSTSITTQPSGATLCAGSPLNLSVVASGSGTLGYQWNLNSSPITNATSSTYTVSNVTGADAGSYTVDITGGCNTLTSTAATVTVNGVTITADPTDQTICESSNQTFSVTATGLGTLSYQWQSDNGTGSFTDIAGETSSTLVLNSVSLTSNGYKYRVIIKDDNSCPATSASATLTVNPLASITTQPSGATLCTGSPLNLSVVAAGSGTLTYQWNLNGSPIASSTSSTYNVSNVTGADAGSYTVDITGGCNNLTSTAATVTVNGVTVTANPTDQTICENGSLTFSITATGLGTLSYQWQTDNGTGTFTDIAGETSSALVLNAVSLTSNGYRYRAIIKDDNSCPATSASALLTVTPLTVITIPPSGANLCVGSPLNLSVVATGSGTLGYQWNLNGSPIASATSSTYTVSSVTAADAGSYTVDITSGCNNLTASATVTVNGVTITANPTDQTICESSNQTFNVTATGLGTLSYQWQTDNGTGTFTDIAGETSSALVLNAVSLTSNGYRYRTIIKDDNSCPATSASALLTVTPLTVITTQPSGATLCTGSPLNLSVVATGSGTLGYQWNLNGSPIASATFSTYTISSVTGIDAGSYTVDITGGCNNLTSTAATVTVNGVTITADPSDTIICESGNHTFKVIATGLGTLSYQWQTDNGTGTFTDIAGETSSALVLNAVSLTLNGYRYRAIIKDDNLCPATSASATLTVNPLTVITTQPSGATLCGGALNLMVVATGSGTLGYQWNLNGSPVASATSSTYTVSNPTGTDAGTYTVDITGGCNNLTSSSAVVTVNKVTLTSQPSDTTICPGTNAAFQVTASGIGSLSYQWQTDNGTGTFSDITAANSSTYNLSLVAPSSNGYKYQVIITDNNLCPDTSASATLNVRQGIVQAYAGRDTSTCSNIVILNASPAGGVWSISSGIGSFSNVNDEKATVTGFGAANKYVWTVSNACGSSSDTVMVNKISNNMALSAVVSKDTSCAGQEITITTSISGGSGSYTYNYSSLDGLFNTSSTNPAFTVSPSIPTRYVVIAADNNLGGCVSNIDTVSVLVVPAQEAFMANLITPNNDGKNDKLVVFDLNGLPMLDASSLHVCNRWGETLYRSNDYKNDFEAEGLPDGVYYMSFKTGCGGKESKGWLHVIRGDKGE